MRDQRGTEQEHRPTRVRYAMDRQALRHHVLHQRSIGDRVTSSGRLRYGDTGAVGAALDMRIRQTLVAQGRARIIKPDLFYDMLQRVTEEVKDMVW